MEPNRPNHRRSPSLWLAALAGIGALTVAFVVFVFLVVFTALSKRSTEETSLFDEDSERPKVGVVELTKEIKDETVKPVIKNLYKFAEDEDIKAIVLRIESPGGSAAASQELYNAIKRVRKNKPVVASMGTIAASGGYYVACAAEKIFANPATITASIGVIAITTEIKELLEWMKMKPHIYKTGKYKDMLSPLRAPTPEDEELINQLINDVYEQFIHDVLAGRPKLKEEDLRKIADGRIMTGKLAKKLGLVDELGGLRDAAREALKLAGVEPTKEPKLVYPKKDAEELLLKFIGKAAATTIESAIKGGTEGVGAKRGVLLLLPEN